jgi:hypothetical protein
MAEMVGSAVVQEVVSGAFSFMRNNHEEMASQSHLMERLKFAHLELKFALERTKRMPIIEVSLLQRRMMLKHVFEESRDLLYKLRTPRINLEGEGAEQGVTLSPSLHNRIVVAGRAWQPLLSHLTRSNKEEDEHWTRDFSGPARERRRGRTHTQIFLIFTMST